MAPGKRARSYMQSGRNIIGLASALIAAAPVSSQALPTGNPLDPTMATADSSREIDCLAAAVAYEAGLEPLEGQQAVAEVVMNRVRNGAFPKTVCGVVYQGSERRTGCQFTFTCDGSLVRRRLPERMLAAARMVATDALNGALPDVVPGATFYHAYYVAPRWAPQLTRVGQIGAHIFYRAGPGQALDSYRPPFGDTPATAMTALRRSTAKAPQTFSPWGLHLPKPAGAQPLQSAALD